MYVGTGVLHNRVVDILHNEGCTGFEAHPIAWRELTEWCEWVGPKAKALEWPQYFRIEISGGVDLDWSLIDADPSLRCPECHAVFPGAVRPKAKSLLRLPVEGTWDGCDFSTWRNTWPGETTTTLCSRRVVDLAAKYKWTNANFGRTVPPDVWVGSPISADWHAQITARLKERHPELFEESPARDL
jgi:hypothetical protein